MALITLHSKRERRDSYSRNNENDSGDEGGGTLQKRARASRTVERTSVAATTTTSGRPPSGRPASLTSLTLTLSPIAEHRRFATSSPALRRATNPAQSKQSLFEDTGDDDDDEVTEEVGRSDGGAAVYG